MSGVIDLNIPENKLTQTIVDCLFHVHKTLGPGLLEGIYERCLCHEMKKRGLFFERQKSVPIRYDDLIIEHALRIDIVVERAVILELKSAETLLPVHQAQLISYLRLSGLPIGFLVNFNVPLMKDGLKRFVNTSGNTASPRLRGEDKKDSEICC